MISLWLFKIGWFADAAAPPCTINSHSFFGFPPWWKYLGTQTDPLGKCVPSFNPPGDIWAVGLAVVDMLLYLAGLVAVISIIIAGVQYIMTVGNAEKGVSARKRIVNSLIGLAIVLIATASVNFIGSSIK